MVEANFPRGTASQRHYLSLGSLCVDCEQSLFFFRFSKGSAHARALSGEAARRKKRGRQPECLSRLAPSVKRLVICVSRAFCSTDQEKRETARSLVCVIRHQLISMKRSKSVDRKRSFFYRARRGERKSKIERFSSLILSILL